MVQYKLFVTPKSIDLINKSFYIFCGLVSWRRTNARKCSWWSTCEFWLKNTDGSWRYKSYRICKLSGLTER